MVLLVAVLVVSTQVVRVLMALRHYILIKETLPQVQRNILFALEVVRDVVAVVAVLVDQVVDSVVAQAMFKVQD